MGTICIQFCLANLISVGYFALHLWQSLHLWETLFYICGIFYFVGCHVGLVQVNTDATSTLRAC